MKALVRKSLIGLTALVLILRMLPSFSTPIYADDTNRTVNVGFFAYPGYHEFENNTRSGLGYDFLALLQRYTHLNYEFTGYGNSWDDMLQMLQNEEIDLVTSARKTLEREELFDFSEPIGTNSAQINVRKNDDRFTLGDFAALNGITIGELTGNSRNDDVADFAAEKGFTYKVKEYCNAEELARALQDGAVDAIATSSLRKAVNEKTIAEFAPQDFYCIVRKGDTELLREINYGISQMDINEGNWRDDLYYKNYGADYDEVLSFTQREKDYIRAVQNGEKTITASAQPDANPYSYLDNGTLTGIIPDYFDHLMSMAGLPYTLLAAEDRTEFHQWVETNHTDVVMDFRFGSVMSALEKFGMVTDSYMELTTSRVTRKGFSGRIGIIAAVESWGIDSVEEDFSPDTQVVRYPSREAAVRAVSDNRADVCYVYTYTAEKLMNTDPNSNLQASILSSPVYSEHIYISPNADHELCSILNKCIKADSSGVLDEYVRKYTTVTYDTLSLWDYLKQHPAVIFFGMVGMMLTAAIIVAVIIRSRSIEMKNERLKKELEQQRRLEESLTFTNFFLDTYASAYYVNFDTLECRVYKRTQELEEKFPIVGNYLESLTEYINSCVHPEDREELIRVTRPAEMKQLIRDYGEYIHLFRDISDGTERMYKMQVISSEIENQAAFGFIDITEEFQEQRRHFLGAVSLSPDILFKANIGLWAFELDEGKAPRMYVDDTMLGLLGLEHQVSPEETYHAWYDHVDEGAYDLVNEAVGKMSAGEHAEVQYPWHHPNGTTMIVRCGGVCNPEYTDGIRIEGTHQNVTAVLHYDEEEQRKERESLALNLVTSLSDSYSSLYYVVPETGEYQLITRDDEFGQKVNTRLSHGGDFYQDSTDSVPRVIYAEDHEKMTPFRSRGNMEEAFGENDYFTVDYRLLIDGEPVWYRVKAAKISGPDNSVFYAIGIMSIQEELRQKEAAARDAAVIAGLSDDFGCVVYVDYTTGSEIHYRFDPLLSATIPGWEEISNFDERMRTLTERLVVAEDREEFRHTGEIKERILEIIDREGVYYRNFRVDIDGEIRYYQLKMVRDESSEHHVIAGLRNVDDTAKKELEYQAKLEEANKSKTDFLFNMSHDIRTPMNAIIGFTELAKKHVDDRARVLDSLSKIELSGNHLLELINEVLDMSRVEAGKLHSDMKAVSISEEAQRLITICRESAAARNISLEYKEENIVHPIVMADVLHVNQIVMNILGNAIKYTLPFGKVCYTVAETESEVRGYGRYVLTVEDTGVGMSPEFLEHIFDSFTREERATTSEIQGTGLGMAIVKRLVDYMDGTINIESEQDKGTKVTIVIHLQIADSAEASAAAEAVEQTSLEGRTVLLVEDNELNREIAVDMLTEQGIFVEEAVNGFEAVDRIREHEPGYYDFVLMDIQMPMMDGYETTAKIRKMPGMAKLPIIALSANAFEEDKKRSAAAGMNAHVSKPIVLSKLLEVLSGFTK